MTGQERDTNERLHVWLTTEKCFVKQVVFQLKRYLFSTICALMRMPLDYSKWDNLQDSSDEEVAAMVMLTIGTPPQAATPPLPMTP